MSKSLVPKRNIFKSDFIGNAPKLKLSVRTCSFDTYATFVFIRSFELHDMFKLPHDTAMTKWVELNSHSVSKTFVVTCLEWARGILWEYSRVHTQITIFWPKCFLFPKSFAHCVMLLMILNLWQFLSFIQAIGGWYISLTIHWCRYRNSVCTSHYLSLELC